MRLVALAIVLVTGLVAAVAPGTRAYHEDWSVGPGDVPKVDWATVIWAQDGDIMGANLQDREVYTVVENAAADPESLPGSIDIDYGVVVWEDQGNIRLKNLRSEKILDIATGGARPTVSRGWVAWLTFDDNSVPMIMARNLKTMADPVVIARSEHIGQGPIISESRVVWEENPALHQWQLFTATLDPAVGSEPVMVAEGSSVSPGSFGFDLEGFTLVYVTSSNDFAALDLRTGDTTIIEATPYSQRPTTDGRYVFWMNTREDVDIATFDLYGYDLSTGSRFMIAPDVGMPDANAGGLTWTNGNEVYAAEVTDVLPSAPRPQPTTTEPTWRYFPETGHTLQLGFKGYWDQSGGLPVFGYPLTEEFTQLNPDTGEFHTVQYFERQRFEWHPENAGTPYEVLLGRLGVEMFSNRQGGWWQLPKADPSTPHYVPETGHAIAPEFWDYWSSHGLEFGDPGVSYRESVALFGYPISEPMVETNADGDTVLTQYFERAVFEHHPNNPAEWQVLLRRAGAEVLRGQNW